MADDDKDPKPKNGDPNPKDPDKGDETDWKAEADKWKALSRKHEADSKKNADAAKKLEDIEAANKTDAEKATEALRTAEGKAAAAEKELVRTRVALRKGLTEAHAKRLVGDTEEELEADADELISSFGSNEEDSGKGAPRKPQENLRPGASPKKDPEPSAKDIVDKVMARSY